MPARHEECLIHCTYGLRTHQYYSVNQACTDTVPSLEFLNPVWAINCLPACLQDSLALLCTLVAIILRPDEAKEMRNLRNTGHKAGEAPADITATCWDASKDEVLVACGPSAPSQKIELLRVVEDLDQHDPAHPL